MVSPRRGDKWHVSDISIVIAVPRSRYRGSNIVICARTGSVTISKWEMGVKSRLFRASTCANYIQQQNKNSSHGLARDVCNAPAIARRPIKPDNNVQRYAEHIEPSFNLPFTFLSHARGSPSFNNRLTIAYGADLGILVGDPNALGGCIGLKALSNTCNWSVVQSSSTANLPKM